MEASNVFGFFDLVLVYFSGLYSESSQTGEVNPVEAPTGKTDLYAGRTSSRTLTFSGSTDWTGTLAWEEDGAVSADFLYTAMGMNIDVSVDGLMGMTQGILNYHSDHFDVDGKMLVREDSVISASSVGTSTEYENGLPDGPSSLSQNYPNPAFSKTTVPFRLQQASQVTIKLYDLLGRHVVTLLDESMIEGSHKVSFYGGFLSSGLYMLRMEARQEDGTKIEDTKKLVVLRQ